MFYNYNYISEIANLQLGLVLSLDFVFQVLFLDLILYKSLYLGLTFTYLLITSLYVC